MERFGDGVSKGLSPYNTAKMFVDALVKAEFLNKAGFEMSGDDNNFTFKAIECPYKSHCTRLIDEGKRLHALGP